MKAKPFHFKQFTVHQYQSALKVGTDGVLLGAWTNCSTAKRILDIGAGTGVVSIMLAQRSKADITAIEIETGAAEQSASNFSNSKWSNRLECIHNSVQNYASRENIKQFDLIVSNPPFFAVQKETTKRSTARSEQELRLVELIQCVDLLLTNEGRFTIIFPNNRKKELYELAEQFQLYPNTVCTIKGTDASEAKRILVEFSRKVEELKESQLVIEVERHNYTEAYQALLKDYLTIF